jgi:hypothetical protein
VPTVIAAHIDGKGYAGARFKSITYLINVDKVAQRITVAEKGPQLPAASCPHPHGRRGQTRGLGSQVRQNHRNLRHPCTQRGRFR